jgi:predicted nucleic acid-binding protein
MERRKEEPRIVADTNILISALLKDHSVHARLIKSKLFSIYFPEYGLNEIEKYRSYIIAKRERNSQSLSLEYSERYIMEEINIAPFDLYCQKIKDASQVMKDIDEKDAPILALALQLCCPIWSNDKHFKRQKTAKVYTTADLLDLLNSVDADRSIIKLSIEEKPNQEGVQD